MKHPGILRSLLLLFALLTTGWGCASSVSADTGDERVFVRVRSVDDLGGGGRFLIGAFEVSAMGSDLYWMSGKYSSKARKLRAVRGKYKATAPDTLLMANDTLLWEFIEEESGEYSLRSFVKQTWVFADGGQNTNLSLNEEKKSSWILSEENGFFNAQNAESESCCIGLSKIETAYFGNYKESDSKDLIIYKERQKADIEPGAWPADGTKVALSSRSTMVGNRLQPMSLDGYVLQDGTIACDDAVKAWTFRASADSCFTLRTEGGKWLTHGLTEDDEEALWKISGGRIATNEAAPRYLCLAGETLRLLPLDEAEYAHNVVMKMVGEKPAAETHDGQMTLRGAWSRSRLAALDWENADRLDLTSISLPRTLAPFASRPANSIVYVSEEGASIVPGDWAFTVKRAEDADTLLTTAEITDGRALHIDRPIVMPHDAMAAYERSACGDGLWETLCVPFVAVIPSSFSAESLVSATTSDLTFATTGATAANEPVIVRYVGTTAAERPVLKLTAEAGTLGPTTDFGNSTFSGAYEPLSVDAGSQNLYLLNAEGTAFVRAAAGSSLSPFRAGLVLSAESKSIRVKHILPTAIEGVPSNGGSEAEGIYTVDGRKVRANAAGEGLPSGIYIKEGKKIMVR